MPSSPFGPSPGIALLPAVHIIEIKWDWCLDSGKTWWGPLLCAHFSHKKPWIQWALSSLLSITSMIVFLFLATFEEIEEAPNYCSMRPLLVWKMLKVSSGTQRSVKATLWQPWMVKFQSSMNSFSSFIRTCLVGWMSRKLGVSLSSHSGTLLSAWPVLARFDGLCSSFLWELNDALRLNHLNCQPVN